MPRPLGLRGVNSAATVDSKDLMFDPSALLSPQSFFALSQLLDEERPDEPIFVPATFQAVIAEGAFDPMLWRYFGPQARRPEFEDTRSGSAMFPSCLRFLAARNSPTGFVRTTFAIRAVRAGPRRRYRKPHDRHRPASPGSLPMAGRSGPLRGVAVSAVALVARIASKVGLRPLHLGWGNCCGGGTAWL